jgi:hypothetical protein
MRRAEADEQRPTSRGRRAQTERAPTERTAANDPDDHQSANGGSSAEVAHATARGAPHRRAPSPRGACVVRGPLLAAPSGDCSRWRRSRTLPFSKRRQPPCGLFPMRGRTLLRDCIPFLSAERERWRAGNHAPPPPCTRAGWLEGPGGHPKRSARWLECCTSDIEPPSSAVDFARGALKRRKHRFREPVISSRRLHSSDESVRAGSSLESGRYPEFAGARMARANTGTASGRAAPQPTRHTHRPGASARRQLPHSSPASRLLTRHLPHISRSEQQPPAEVGVGKLTRRRRGAGREDTALESQQKFSAEPLIDAAAAPVASGAHLEVSSRP